MLLILFFAAPSPPVDSDEAARSVVYPALSRALHKYLRATRQQPRHSADAVVAHLAKCIRHGAAPRAFLEKYLVAAPVLQVHCHYALFPN